VSELGRGSRSGPLVPPNPSRPSPKSPLPCAAAPSLSSLWPPPPHPPSPLFPKCYSRPLPSPLLQVSFFLAGSSLCGCKFRLENWWEEGRRKGRTQCDFVIIFCCIYAAIKLIICLPMQIASGAVQKFCGRANNSSSSDFWEFFVGN
jgi:hypothetical protein